MVRSHGELPCSASCDERDWSVLQGDFALCTHGSRSPSDDLDRAKHAGLEIGAEPDRETDTLMQRLMLEPSGCVMLVSKGCLPCEGIAGQDQDGVHADSWRVERP